VDIWGVLSSLVAINMKLFTFLFLAVLSLSLNAETLPPLVDGKAPQNYEELWKGFDPRKEPLDVEVLKEWEEGNVVIRIVRYRIGIFKGKKAMMAAVYGFPKGGKSLPGLLQIHGGGQYADSKAVVTNAKRGYATISIAWAGRISSPKYRVSPKEVKLFWENKTEDPAYKVTTDWGALDAYHAPSRNGKDAFASIPDGSQEWTLDDVPSPRNNSWFLVTIGARRALTFLEQQPEVHPPSLGVYGHSMGGKLTIATAASDKRVIAAAPSCGGISDRYNLDPLHSKTIGDSPALQHVICPTIFLSPANDFHGHINNLRDTIQEMCCAEWRVTCSAHLNHRDYPENEVATQLWFDKRLKGSFEWPKTPKTELELKPNSMPILKVFPDTSKKILGVEVYYTQQGKVGKEPRINRMAQFWHHAKVFKFRKGDPIQAGLPLYSTDLPLWVFANVIYALDEPITGAGYYYGEYTTKKFNLSSLIEIVSAKELQAAKVQTGLKPSLTIEKFEEDWEKEWYYYANDGWGIRTHKVYHPIWKAPEGATLAMEVKAGKENLLLVGLDDHVAEVELKGDSKWQMVTLSLCDFKDVNEASLETWDGLKELRLLPKDTLRSKDRKNRTTRKVGGEWQGEPPLFRNLRWVE